MPRARVGEDEIRFGEATRLALDLLRGIVPKVRREVQDVTGATAPPLRIVLTAGPPAARDLLRFSRWFLPAMAALTIAGLVEALRGDATILATPALAVAFPAYSVQRGLRQARKSWRHLGGLAYEWRPILDPTIALHWPPPQPSDVVRELRLPPADPAESLCSVFAHEYAHVLLRSHYRIHAIRISASQAIPVWLDEGFASWLADELVHRQTWRPESRAFVEEPEPAGDPRWGPGHDTYYHLCARYYWEVHSIAERGLLPDLLRLPLARAEEFRPTLRAP